MNQWLNFNYIAFLDIAVNGNDGWFCNLYCSALFHIDLITLKTDYVCLLPSDDVLRFANYCPIEYYDGKLIILPFNDNKILIYDIYEKCFISIIDITEFVNYSAGLFVDLTVIENEAILIPGRGRNLLKLNLHSMSISLLFEFEEEIINAQNRNELLLRKAIHLDELIILPFCSSNRFFRLNKKDMVCSYIDFTEPFSSVLELDEKYILSSQDSMKLIVVDKKWNIHKEIEISFDGLLAENGIGYITRYKNYIYIYPRHGSMLLVLDYNTWKIDKVLDISFTYKDRIGNFAHIGCTRVTETLTCTIFLSLTDKSIYSINLETNTINSVTSLMDGQSREKLYFDVKEHLNSVMKYRIETINLGLLDFIHSI